MSCRSKANDANKQWRTPLPAPGSPRPLVGACPGPGRTGAVRGHARAVRGHGLRRQPGVPGRPAEPGHRPSHRLSAVHNFGLGIQPPPSPGPGLPRQSVFGPGRRSHGRRVVPGRTPVGQQPAGRSHSQHGLCAQHHLVVAGYHRRGLHPQRPLRRPHSLSHPLPRHPAPSTQPIDALLPPPSTLHPPPSTPSSRPRLHLRPGPDPSPHDAAAGAGRRRLCAVDRPRPAAPAA